MWRFLNKRNTELPPNPAIPLGIYVDKTITQKDTSTPVLRAALCTTVETRKQPRRPSTDEWIQKTWCMCATESPSAVTKNEIMPFATTQKDLETIILSEASQRKTHTIGYHLSLESKMSQMNTSMKQKQEQTHGYRERTCGCQEGRGWGRDGVEFGVSGCKLLYVGWMHNKVLLCSTTFNIL